MKKVVILVATTVQVDNKPVEVKPRDIITLDDKVAAALVKAGQADDNAEAVGFHADTYKQLRDKDDAAEQSAEVKK